MIPFARKVIHKHSFHTPEMKKKRKKKKKKKVNKTCLHGDSQVVVLFNFISLFLSFFLSLFNFIYLFIHLFIYGRGKGGFGGKNWE